MMLRCPIPRKRKPGLARHAAVLTCGAELAVGLGKLRAHAPLSLWDEGSRTTRRMSRPPDSTIASGQTRRVRSSPGGSEPQCDEPKSVVSSRPQSSRIRVAWLRAAS